MTAKKNVLSFYIILFLIFGLIALVMPALITHEIGYKLQTAAAEIEFRATYGGLFISLGLYMLYCLYKHLNAGLVCVLFTMGGMLAVRLVTAFTLGGVDLIQAIYISGELFTVLLVSFILYKSRRVRSF